MSNYTDGKKALSVGDFPKAESKLIKALDNRPDDGELWWALMLCKCGFRNDGELTESLKAEFSSAAREGGGLPSTPFDSTYCKNALRFDKSGKRKAFIAALNAELSELWAAERGKAPRLRTAREPIDKAALLKLLTYISVGISSVGGVLAVYSIFALARWALWSGFVVFLSFAVAAIVLRWLTTRVGGNARHALALVVGVFAAVCVGLFIAGVVRRNRDVMIFSASVFLLIVMASAFHFSYGKFAAKAAKRGKPPNGKSTDTAHSRDPNVLITNGKNSKGAVKNGNSENPKTRTVDNEYKDEYD